MQLIFAFSFQQFPQVFGAINWFSERAKEFLSFSNNGALLAFGPKYTDHMLPFIVWNNGIRSGGGGWGNSPKEKEKEKKRKKKEEKGIETAENGENTRKILKFVHS